MWHAASGAWTRPTAGAGPRAASDYIEIATEYHTVLLGGIASFTDGHHDPVRRFITLVDDFYDRHVNLICTAAAAPPPYTQKWAGAFDPDAVGRIPGAGASRPGTAMRSIHTRERYSPAAA